LLLVAAGAICGCGRDWTFPVGTCGPGAATAKEDPPGYADESCGGYTGNHLWSVKVGGEGVQQVRALAADPSDDTVLIAGDFEGTIDLGNGPHVSAGLKDMFVAKLDGADGSVLFSKAFGSEGNDLATAIAVDEEGSIFVTGGFQGAVDFGDGAPLNAGSSYDVFVAIFEPDGKLHSKWDLGDTAGAQIAYGIAVDDKGRVALTGTFGGALLLAGTQPMINPDPGDPGDLFVLIQRPYQSPELKFGRSGIGLQVGESVAFDSTGALLVGGTIAGHAGDPDVVTSTLLKFDENGGDPVEETFGKTESWHFGRVALDPAGNVAASTGFKGLIDIGGGPYESAEGRLDCLVAKLSPTGGHVWSTHFGDASDDRCVSTIDAGGHITAAVVFRGAVDLGAGPMSSEGDSSDVLLARWDEAGDLLHARVYGGSEDESAKAIATAPDGGVYLAGSFKGAVSWGGDTFFASLSGADGFVARYAP